MAVPLGYGILVLQPGTEPGPSEMTAESQSLDHKGIPNIEIIKWSQIDILELKVLWAFTCVYYIKY